MTTWIVIAAVAVGSYALRAVMLVLVTVKPLPPRVQQAMAYVGPAAVAALVATLAFTRNGVVVAAPLAEVTALVAAFVVVRRTGNALHAITVGFPLFWVLAAAGL